MTASSPQVARSRSQRRTQTREAQRPELHIVAALAPQKNNLPFLVLIATIFLSAFLVQLVVNAQMVSTAYAMQEKQIELNELQDHTETLQTQVERASSPETLAQRAEELGMVRAQAPGAICLEDGTITGGEAAVHTEQSLAVALGQSDTDEESDDQ